MEGRFDTYLKHSLGIEFVQNLDNVGLLFLLDDFEILVVIEIAEFHQLQHDGLLGILELLVDLFRIGDSLVHFFHIACTLIHGVAGCCSCTNTLGRRLSLCCLGSSCCRRAWIIAPAVVGPLESLLYAHHVVKLALVLEVGYD